MNNYTDIVRISNQQPAPEERSTPQQSGVTRISYGQPEPSAAPVSLPAPTRVCGETLEFTMGGNGPVERTGLARHTASFDGVAGGSVLATRQRQMGHDTVEVVPGIAGSRTLLSVAIRQGVIKETGPGIYEDVTGAPAALEQAVGADAAPDEQAPGDPGAGLYDPEEDADWAAAILPLEQFAYDSAASSVTLAVVTGGDLDSAAQALSRDAGIEPALAAEFVAAGFSIHERAVAAAVAPLGIDGPRKEAYYEFARQHPQKLQEAAQRLLHQRDPSGFVELARGFKKAHPGDLSALHAAGFETHIGADGETLLKRPGGNWVRASELAR